MFLIYGGGSLLDIELEKDVIVPRKFVHDISPDCTNPYGICKIYGVSESFYDVA